MPPIKTRALWSVSGLALAALLCLPAGSHMAAMAQDQDDAVEQEAVAADDGERGNLMFWFLDRNDDGYIDADEMSAFRGKLFERMDRDGDGQITREEVSRMGMQRGKGHRHGAHARHRHGGERGVHQGRRHGGEHHRGWRQSRGGENAEQTRQGRQGLSAEERNARRDARREARADRIWDRRFARYDANNDGVVTRDEFVAQMPRMFVFADTDGDGRVSLQEARELRVFLRDARGGHGGWFR